MKDTKLVIPKSDLEIIIAKFYRLKDVTIETTHIMAHDYTVEVTAPFLDAVVTANYPIKRRKK